MASESKGVMHGPRYIRGTAELEASAIAKLGSMDEGSYVDFVRRMLKVAEEAGITLPKLGISVKFKEGFEQESHSFVKAQPSKLTNAEWEAFKKDAERMCECMPAVFVIDGSKVTSGKSQKNKAL